MKYAFISLVFAAITQRLNAQDFVTRGRIEYEVKVNLKLMARNSGYNYMDQDMFGLRQEFQTSYKEMVFTNDEWIYRPLKKKTEDGSINTEVSIYGNKNTGVIETRSKYESDEWYIFKDSLPSFRWKIESETRKIAGWVCRKAVTRIHDSVYVIAFYCPEIIPQTGPGIFNGLPGMILGLAIPRYYKTWFATKVELADVDESKVRSLEARKEKVYSKKELVEILIKQFKADGWDDVSDTDVLAILERVAY